MALTSFQKKYLRALAHGLKPVVLIGQKGVSDTLIQAVDSALTDHELIKIRFNEFKEKSQMMVIIADVEQNCRCRLAGLIGHAAILFRRHSDPDKRKIMLPGWSFNRSASAGTHPDGNFFD
ncbi:MAG: YhbY family RNA-binding protein [Eubacteriales bacterium]|nr:YhbY family RNA-binding protein [Eubacteriales bacterium]MDD3082551.1 YhbY family RNA-binding protein [Desulfobacterales bacterium]